MIIVHIWLHGQCHVYLRLTKSTSVAWDGVIVGRTGFEFMPSSAQAVPDHLQEHGWEVAPSHRLEVESNPGLGWQGQLGLLPASPVRLLRAGL